MALIDPTNETFLARPGVGDDELVGNHLALAFLLGVSMVIHRRWRQTGHGRAGPFPASGRKIRVFIFIIQFHLVSPATG